MNHEPILINVEQECPCLFEDITKLSDAKQRCLCAFAAVVIIFAAAVQLLMVGCLVTRD